jgi:Zn-dependent M28 family amino/carboxypeptidase
MVKPGGNCMAEIQTANATLSGRLSAHVRRLAGDIGERNVSRPDALHAAAAYIEQVWAGQGYGIQRQTYTVRGVECANLEVSRTGSKLPQATLLLGAHYDSVRGSPGANDNASGVAALLELAGMFAAVAPVLSVRCVCFVNEEPPFFFTGQQGSVLYARAARRRGDDIRLMLSLETMGCYDDTPGSQGYPPMLRWFYPPRADFIAFVSNLRSRAMLKRLAAAFRSVSDFPAEYAALPAFVPGVAWSDHLSFWRQGYRALMVTDTAFYRYAWYHSAGDTPDRLDYQRLAEVTGGLFGAVMRLAEELGQEVSA